MIFDSGNIDEYSFSLEHLKKSEINESLVMEFSVSEKSAIGLENYLKYTSFIDEDDNMARSYLVKDCVTGEIACYFTLRTGLITQRVSEDDDNLFDSIPAVELSNFAVNANYKKKHPEVQRFGHFVLYNYIFPIVRTVADYVGVKVLYIYALPNEKLIEHYKTMGFHRLSSKNEKFVQSHVKPKYDAECIFMCQTI